MEGENRMTISFKMVDGSRYEFEDSKEQIEMYERIWELRGLPDIVPIEEENKTVILNGKHIVSITIKGDDNDSKTIP